MDYFISTTLSTLEQLIKNEKDAEIRQKLLVVWHKKWGATDRHIADILLIPRSTVGYLTRKFKKEGVKGFQRKPGSGGHNRYLTKEQEKELHDKLKKYPMTTKEVLVQVKENYGKQYHPKSIPRLLRRIGESLITPRKRHYKANKVKIFVKEQKGNLIIWPLPKRLPELSPMEPGWRSARKNVTYRLFDNKEDLGQAVKKHIEQEFKMNLAKFWS